MSATASSGPSSRSFPKVDERASRYRRERRRSCGVRREMYPFVYDGASEVVAATGTTILLPGEATPKGRRGAPTPGRTLTGRCMFMFIIRAAISVSFLFSFSRGKAVGEESGACEGVVVVERGGRLQASRHKLWIEPANRYPLAPYPGGNQVPELRTTCGTRPVPVPRSRNSLSKTRTNCTNSLSKTRTNCTNRLSKIRNRRTAFTVLSVCCKQMRCLACVASGKWQVASGVQVDGPIPLLLLRYPGFSIPIVVSTNYCTKLGKSISHRQPATE